MAQLERSFILNTKTPYGLGKKNNNDNVSQAHR